jgi:hypothetical protein
MLLVDRAALALQRLPHGKAAPDELPLVGIDNADANAQAPFRYDSASGTLHRSTCRAIGKEARSSLYAVWRMEPEESVKTCGKCKPMPEHSKTQEFATSDILFGLVSIVDQFGTVLFERGREYRKSIRGKELEKSLSGILKELDRGQKKGLSMVASSLDSMIRAVSGYESQLTKGNGRAANRGGPKKGGKQAR